MHSLVEYFVSRSIFVNLLTVLLIVAGSYTAVTMNKEAFPNIQFDIVSVVTVYPGASPQEIEKLVTTPLEDSIKEVDGLKEYRSTSIENRSAITLLIDPDVKDTKKVVDDIRSAVDRTDDLPADAEKPVIIEVGTARTPVVEFFLGRVEKDGKTLLTDRQLRDQAEILEKRLEGVRGVARVERRGWRETEMQVDLNPYLLQRYYVGTDAVVNALKLRNINLPGGRIERNEKEVIVRTIGEFDGPKDIERTVIRANEIGQAVSIKDVGTVTEGFAEANILERADGYEAITLIVIKRESADVIKVVDQAKDVVEDYKKTMPAGLKVDHANDLSFFVRRRLGVLMSNGITGLLLVVASLFVFLGWRIAVMATLGIPVAIGMTFMAMQGLGVTLNLISMFGLILVIGIVVDDAIIVCENIFRYLEMGHGAYDSVVKGTQEVIAPVLATISTTIAAFGPMLFMTGIFGKFVYFIPLVVILALLASLLESFFILPSHVYDISKYSRPKEEGPTFRDNWFNALRDRFYKPRLRWALKHRSLVLGGLTLLLIVTFALQGLLGSFKLFPSAIDAFFIKITAERGLTKEATLRYAKAVEEAVNELAPDDPKLPVEQRELKNFTTRVGIIQLQPNDPFVKRGSNYAMVRVFLTPEQDRKRKTKEIVETLRARTAYLLSDAAKKEMANKKQSATAKTPNQPGTTAAETGSADKGESPAPSKIPDKYKDLAGKLVGLDFEEQQGGPPVGKPVAIQIVGKDYDVLKKIGAEYKKVLEKVEGVTDIGDDFQAGKDEIRLSVNEGLAAQTGLSVTQVAVAVNTAFDGNVATKIKRLTEEVDVRVRFAERFRQSPRMLDEIFVQNRTGYLVPISQMAVFEQGQGVVALNHLDGNRLLTVTANVDETKTNSAKANAEVAKLAKGIIEKYAGYRVSFGGENQDTEESMASMGRAFIIGLLIIFMILASLFKSIMQPVVVVAAIPFSLIGVVFAFLTHGHPFSFLAMMGVIGLAGVVVNDSIVLVDFANTIRDENPEMPIDEVVEQAGALRLRAVLLTTITTVVGLLPTAYGIGGYDPFLVPMALSFAWGLLFATFLTLGVVPILYKTEHQLKNWIKRLLGFQSSEEGVVESSESNVDVSYKSPHS